jgi:hypothetical protein
MSWISKFSLKNLEKTYYNTLACKGGNKARPRLLAQSSC